jgi:LL-diaminopimelate aminotransferase
MRTKRRAERVERAKKVASSGARGGQGADSARAASAGKPAGGAGGGAGEIRAARLRGLPPFLFNAIDDKKRAAIAAGKDVINLGVGDPDQPTPGFIIDELVRSAKVASNHQYPACYGTKRFLDAAASFMHRRFGMKLGEGGLDPAKHIVALIGGKDGISHLPLGVVDPGQRVVIFTPAYPVYNQASIMAGARVKLIATRPEDQWRPNLGPTSELSDALLRATKLLWVNFPGNPTGASIPPKDLDTLMKRVLAHETIIASDLAYSEIYFEHGPQSCPSIFQCPSVDIRRHKVIEFHSCSKTFNMTGWRIGFAVGHEDVIKALKQTKDNYDSGPFNAVQDAAAAALERFDDPIIAGQRAEYARRRDIVVAGLRAIGCEVTPPEAGIFVWARCPKASATGTVMSSWAFVEKAIEEAAVVTVPGAGFAETATNYVRVSLTRETPRLAEAMKRLAGVKW